jgi:predicted amino acid dehydrogenase
MAERRPNATVILGGVVAVPADPEFELPGFPLKRGETFACTAETMLLGMAGAGRDFSTGALTTQQVREVMSLARVHGFAPGSYKTTRSY